MRFPGLEWKKINWTDQVAFLILPEEWEEIGAVAEITNDSSSQMMKVGAGQWLKPMHRMSIWWDGEHWRIKKPQERINADAV